MERPDRRLSVRQWAVVASSVLLISALHYETALHAVVLHEVFTRLYYLPIVFAAITGGVAAGLVTAAVASLLYLPHVILGWHASPAIAVGQYAEQVVFVIIAMVAGSVGSRLRHERARAEVARADLAETLARLRASVDEQLRLDRLATTGQLATGMAHELRNPLAAARGALDIVERGDLSPERRIEFFGIARGGLERASTVIQDLLEFAKPRPASDAIVDLVHLVRQTWRLTTGSLGAGDVIAEFEMPNDPVFAHVDVVQAQQALVAFMLETPRATGARRVVITIRDEHGRAAVNFLLQGEPRRSAPWNSLFEPFVDARVGHGLTLALAKRLVENQGGTCRAEEAADGVRVVVTFRGPDVRTHRAGSAA